MMGRVRIYDTSLVVDVGEIKSTSSSYGDAVRQLVIRAKVYGWVGDALLRGKHAVSETVLQGGCFIMGGVITYYTHRRPTMELLLGVSVSHETSSL